MRKCKLSILTMIMFMLLTLLIPMQSTYAVEKTRSFVLDFMPEYTTEYKSLLDYLENEAYKKLTEVSGDKDDTFLPEKAYPAFFLSGALTADGNIDVKPDSMRWIVPTIKNKYMSIMRDGDSFRFLGLFVPDDPDWMSPHMIDLDAIKEIIESNKTTLSLGSFTFIIANEYNFVLTKVECGNQTLIIPQTSDEKATGLTSGKLTTSKDFLTTIHRYLPDAANPDTAYNEDGEAVNSGSSAASNTMKGSHGERIIS